MREILTSDLWEPRRGGPFPIDVAAELGHQPDEDSQGGWLGRWVLTMHDPSFTSGTRYFTMTARALPCGMVCADVGVPAFAG